MSINYSKTEQGYKRISFLKANARGNMMGHYSRLISATLFFLIFGLFFNAMISDVNIISAGISFWVTTVMSLIVSLFVEPLRLGLDRIYLLNSFHQSVRVRDIFYLSDTRDKNGYFLTAFMSLLPFLCTLPANILYAVLSYTSLAGVVPRDDVFLVSMAVLAIGMIIYFLLYLNYGMAYYVKLDFPDMTAKEALQMSKWLMNGNKMRYIVFLLSFLPMFLLGLLSFGIGLIFVFPYLFASTTCFYLDITQVKSHR